MSLPILKLSKQHAAINRAVGDRIIKSFPDAEIVRDGDNYKLISFVHDGIRYEFKARKTGRFALAAKPIATPMQAHELLGMSTQEYTHLLNPSLPKPDTTKRSSAASCRFRLYRCGDCLAITDSDLDEPYVLLSCHPGAGAAIAAARLADPAADLLYDESLKVEFLSHYGRDRYENEVLPNLFAATPEEPEDKKPQRPERRIPNTVLNMIKAGLAKHLEESEDPVLTVASYLDGTHNAARLLSDAAISNLWHAAEQYRDDLISLAVKAHYLNRWVEVEPRKWKFLIFQDLEKDAGRLLSSWKSRKT